METRTQLRTIAKDFAALVQTEYPFLSVYLDTAWDDEMQKDRVRIFLKNELGKIGGDLPVHGPARDSYQADQDQIAEFVFGALPEEAKGLVIFACHGAGIFTPQPLPVSFHPRVVKNHRPYIRPLLRALDENKTALAVHLHAKKGEILEISMGDFVEDLVVESDVPQKVEAGGWAQMRFQRHVEAHIQDHLAEVSSQLIKFFDREQIKYIFLFGPEEIKAEFLKKLPKRLKQASQALADLSPEAGRLGLQQKVLSLLEKQERIEEKDKLARLENEAKSGGKAALGPDQTLVAANRAAIQELLISTLYSERGWYCPNCQALGRSHRDQCSECQASIIQSSHLDNDLVAKILLEDGKVEEIIDNENFDRLGGIGAFLRFIPR